MINEDSVKKELQTIENQIPPFLKITNDEENTKAGEILGQVREAEKNVETRMKEITKPLADAKKSAEALFKPTAQKLATIKENIRTEMGRYFAEKQAAIKKVEEQVSARVEKGTMKEETAATKLSNLAVAPTQTSGSVVKMIKTLVTDGGEAKELLNPKVVPEKYQIISFNYKQMLEDILNGVDVPGAKVVEVPRVDSR